MQAPSPDESCAPCAHQCHQWCEQAVNCAPACLKCCWGTRAQTPHLREGTTASPGELAPLQCSNLHEQQLGVSGCSQLAASALCQQCVGALAPGVHSTLLAGLPEDKSLADALSGSQHATSACVVMEQQGRKRGRQSSSKKECSPRAGFCGSAPGTGVCVRCGTQ